MKLLPGFRDFLPEECARRNYIFTRWRETARRYGFQEFEGPTLELLELYMKKSGGELTGQIFRLSTSGDKGETHMGLRPEMTPTLARILVANERQYRKPLKWFSIPNCFRQERHQRGRLREFYQLNCDIIGEESISADAEMVAALVDFLRAFGFSEQEFVIRVSDRNAWSQFALARGVAQDRILDFLAVLDKLERADDSAVRLQEFGIALEDVRAFIAQPGEEAAALHTLVASLQQRGLGAYVEIDLTIVRGLAYYTGVVFEAFARDRKANPRALAGGGRYDDLLKTMSDGRVSLPALGFGMGDVVLRDMIESIPHAKALRDAWTAAQMSCDVYVVIANEEKRPEALDVIQKLRTAEYSVEFSLRPAKVDKQFQSAQLLGAQFAVLVGSEWPDVKIKRLATREERLIPSESLLEALVQWRTEA